MSIVVHLVLLGLVIYGVAQLLPGIRLDGMGTAIAVAVVYSLINVVIGSVFKFLAFPLIFLTLGLFLLVINAIMLWLTDLVLDDFEIRDAGTTFFAAVLISCGDFLIDVVV